MPSLALAHADAVDSSGGRLVATDGRALPLTRADLRADAKGGIARVVLTQRFVNPFPEPLRVSYQLPLPADGAVSGYAFTLAGQRIVGEVDKKQAARERFERALVEGRTAAILDQERSSLFTQEVGNVPPSTEVIVELSIDQRLSWLADGFWEWRFPTVVAPRYLGGAGSVPDADKLMVDVADRPLGIPLSLGVVIRDALTPGGSPESPSHALHRAEIDGRVELGFADERGALLDRDVVVRWPAAQGAVGLTLETARAPAGSRTSDRAYGLVTLTPPQRAAHAEALPRDLIVLLDTSGSMSGMPLEQSKRVVSALIDSLNDQDQLELIEFSSAPRRWKRGAVHATHGNREDARRWLQKLSAGGGTEMRSGILEAFATLRAEAQRQIVLITDGLIGAEREVIRAICESLPAASRVHVVGVGSGVNRSLTLPASRAGRGVELVIGIGEDAERFGKRLVARTQAPLVTELTVSGSAVRSLAPGRPPDVFAGAPSLLSVELDPEGGELVVRGKTAEGAYEQRVQVPATSAGTGSPAVVALFGREKVEDQELALAAGLTGGVDLNAEIERLGIAFQISTRLTSWVAVSHAVTVDPLAPTRSDRVPQNLPYGMSVEGLGLRPASGAPAPSAMFPPKPQRASNAPASAGAAAPPLLRGKGAEDRRLKKEASKDRESAAEQEESAFPQAPRAEAVDAKEVADLDDGFSGAELPTGAPLPPPPPRAPAPQQDRPAEPTSPAKSRATGRPATKPQARRSLKGRVLLRDAASLVLELVVELAMRWDLPLEVALTLANGTVVLARVDASKTTRAGELSAGTRLRLTLLTTGLGEDPVRATFTTAEGTFEVNL